LIDCRISQFLLQLAGLRDAGFQLIAECRQFIDFGYDAVLFGERRKWKSQSL